MPNFVVAMKESTEFTVLEGGKEALQYYLKRNQILKEMVPLWSKSRLIRQVQEGSEHPDQSDLMKYVKSPMKLFIDVNKIRSYYGDEIAIYFEWMNYF